MKGRIALVLALGFCLTVFGCTSKPETAPQKEITKKEKALEMIKNGEPAQWVCQKLKGGFYPGTTADPSDPVAFEISFFAAGPSGQPTEFSGACVFGD